MEQIKVDLQLTHDEWVTSTFDVNPADFPASNRDGPGRSGGRGETVQTLGGGGTATSSDPGKLTINAKPAPPFKDEIKKPPDPGGDDDVVACITRKLGSEQDPSLEIYKLAKLDMKSLLEALDGLHKLGLFDRLSAYEAKFDTRFGAAFLTVDENYGKQWQKLYAELDKGDQDIIIARVPEGSRPGDYTIPSHDKPEEKNVGWQGQQSGSLQYAVHWTIKRAKVVDADPHKDATYQASFAANYAGHREDASGPEVQALVQFGYDETTKQVTKVAGVQGAYSWSVIKKIMQIQPFIQALAGVASTGKEDSGTLQVAIGIQLLVTVGPVQIGVQGSGGITYTKDSPIDLAGAGSFVIQGNF